MDCSRGIIHAQEYNTKPSAVGGVNTISNAIFGVNRASVWYNACMNEAIRYVREQLGLSQVQLARKVGMKKPQLCIIEKGCFTPKPETIGRLANALGTTPAALKELSEMLKNPSPLRPLFEANQAHVEECARAERASDRLDEQIAAHGIAAATTLPLVQSFVHELHAGVFLAQAMRAALGVGRAAFSDLVWHLELANVRIFLDRLPKDVSSLAWWHVKRNALVIVLSREATPERQIYRLACELGAACLFRSCGDKPLAESKRDKRTIREFAADFLMPATTIAEMAVKLGIRKDGWTLARLCLFKAHFGVSAEAFALRLEELGLIDRNLRVRLRDELRARYTKHPQAMEPAPRLQSLSLARRWEMVSC